MPCKIWISVSVCEAAKDEAGLCTLKHGSKLPLLMMVVVTLVSALAYELSVFLCCDVFKMCLLWCLCSVSYVAGQGRAIFQPFHLGCYTLVSAFVSSHLQLMLMLLSTGSGCDCCAGLGHQHWGRLHSDITHAQHVSAPHRPC